MAQDVLPGGRHGHGLAVFHEALVGYRREDATCGLIERAIDLAAKADALVEALGSAADFADRGLHALVTVDCGDFAEIWKEKVALPAPKPESKKRPVLVNVVTGERIEGAPGMSEDLLFGLYANGML